MDMKERPVGPELISPVRAVRAAAGGGITRLYATVIRGLLYPDAAREEEDGPVEGYGAYILRLTSDTTAAWEFATNYIEGDMVLGSDGFKYESLTGTEETPNVGNDPTGDVVNWQIQTEINPRHLEFGEVSDWRWFVPQIAEGATVELIYKGGHYYFAQQMIRVKSESDGMQTVYWNDTDQRLMSVFG